MLNALHFVTICCMIFIGTVACSTADAVPPIPKELLNQTIVMVIPWNPGGDTDHIQRFVVDQVTQITGLKIVVHNRSGARGMIGGRIVAESKPDGLTLLGDGNGTHVLNPILEKDPIDPNLLQPVAVYGLTPQFFYIASESDIKTVQDLVELAKTKDRFTIGCNTLHQCMYIRQFFAHYGVKVYAVLYKTPVEMAIGVGLKQIDLFGAGATSGAPLVQANKIKAIAVAWPMRLEVYPDAEALGKLVPGYRGNNLQMLSVPSGTPTHIVEYYNQVFRSAIKTPASIAKFRSLSIPTVDLSVPEVERLIIEEFENLQHAKPFAQIP